MRRHDLLAGLHELLAPRTYLEIGVNRGVSMGLSRTRSIGVDPAFKIDHEIRCDVHLVRRSSDEFFASQDAFDHFGAPVADLTFIDGMHLAEYALRDFINVERLSHPASVVVVDDVLPRTSDQAKRRRDPGPWTGDVYKVLETLRQLRRDLVILEMDTLPTGTVVVLNLDPASRVLADAYDDLVESYVSLDPQDVPEAILRRSRALDPEVLLDAPIWQELRRLRDGDADSVRAEVRPLLAGAGLADAS
ncbi:MAG: class I SAM-dependent methyltransferase [Actinomycetota bacterium]|nr:class I SAM-dependent methyltransferase [Actinomycetota bacterium]